MIERASERKSGELITAPERRWSGPPLYTLSMPVLAMNESTEWLQITIITKVPFYLHIHRQTDHSAPHRVRTQTQRAPRAAAAPLRAKGKNWGHWWGERGRQAGRQAGSEEGRKGELREGGREGVGMSGGPAEVGSQVSCPATIVLFVLCVRVCVRGNIIILQALPKICHQHQHTSDTQIY